MLTSEMLQESYDYLNRLCFNGELPACELRLVKDNKDKLAGYCETWDSRVHARISICEKRLNGFHHEEVLLHEMVHFFLYLKHYSKEVGPGYFKSKKFDTRREDKAGHTSEFWSILDELEWKRLMQTKPLAA